MEKKVVIGKTNIEVTPIGLGTWQWGDRILWSYSKTHNDADLKAAFQVSLDAGIDFIDTAEVYGLGYSEKLLGRCLKETSKNVVVATKYFPFPWRLSKRAFRAALKSSLRRLGLEKVDLYQIHWPFPPVAIQTWMDAMADAVEMGLVGAVGVSNYNPTQMQEAYRVLSKRGIPLATNQVEYSLLDQKIERSGLVALCHELDVTIIAYSPLAKGILSGKYTPQNPPAGMRSRKYDRTFLEKVQPLIHLMREIGKESGDKTPAQVALNWALCKGVVAIPGAKNEHQAQDNASALGWRLTEAEIVELDYASRSMTH